MNRKIAVAAIGAIVLAIAVGALGALNSGLTLSNPFSWGSEVSPDQRHLSDPVMRDTDGDSLTDLIETNSSYAQRFSLNYLAQDIIGKCYVTDTVAMKNFTNVFLRLKDDLSYKIEFVNLDNETSGVNFHLDGSCVEIPAGLDFAGAKYYNAERKDIDAGSIKGTSLGQYLDQIAEPADQKIHLQIIFAPFESSRNEYGIVGFSSSENRQIVVNPASDDDTTANTIGHMVGHLIGLDHSDQLDSIMSEPGGPVYYDSEWSARLEEMNQKRQVLFSH